MGKRFIRKTKHLKMDKQYAGDSKELGKTQNGQAGRISIDDELEEVNEREALRNISSGEPEGAVENKIATSLDNE